MPCTASCTTVLAAYEGREMCRSSSVPGQPVRTSGLVAFTFPAKKVIALLPRTGGCSRSSYPGALGARITTMATRCVGLGRGALVGLRRSAQVSQVCRSLRPLSDASERLCLGRPDFQTGGQVRGPVAATCDVSTSLSKRATIAILSAPRWWWPVDCRSCSFSGFDGRPGLHGSHASHVRSSCSSR